VSVSGGVYEAAPGPVGDPLSAPCTTPYRDPSRTAVASVLLSQIARPTSNSPTINNRRSGRTSAVSTSAWPCCFASADPAPKPSLRAKPRPCGTGTPRASLRAQGPLPLGRSVPGPRSAQLVGQCARPVIGYGVSVP